MPDDEVLKQPTNAGFSGW